MTTPVTEGSAQQSRQRASSPSREDQIYMELPHDGYPEASEHVAFTAAPLLAGFAITFIGFILTSKESMYWPNVTLAILTVAAMLLIFAVQLGFNSRRHYLPYAEFKAQLELISNSRPAAVPGAQDRYIASLRSHRALMRWAGRLYNAGVVTLLVAIAAALVPAGTVGTIDTSRVIAIAIAGVAAVVEAAWAIANELSAHRSSR